jgi:hypothetical protein
MDKIKNQVCIYSDSYFKEISTYSFMKWFITQLINQLSTDEC